MAKYITQVIILGTQVVGRAFARALQQEYAATRAAAQTKGGSNKTEADANIKLGMTIQEAKDILNVSSMDKEKITKNYAHLFSVNDKSRGGSFYLQSKDISRNLGFLKFCTGNKMTQLRYFSSISLNDVFSEFSKIRCLKLLEDMKSRYTIRRKAHREAAVMIPLCVVNENPSVLLTLRSTKMGRNKRDVSFPGGMKDFSDFDAIQVALRETEEEVGIPHDSVQIWTTMAPFPSRTGGIKITPVVAFISNLQLENLSVNEDEVECVFTRTLESLCDPDNFFYTQFKAGYTLPVYFGGEHRIWGITAGILHNLLMALLQDVYKNELPYLKLKMH